MLVYVCKSRSRMTYAPTMATAKQAVLSLQVVPRDAE